MKRIGLLVSAGALVAALAIGGPASAFGGRGGGGFHGGGFHGGGFHGGGFHGGGWGGGGFNGGGWRGGNGYGGAGWGLGAGLLGLGLGYGVASSGYYADPYAYGSPYGYGSDGYYGAYNPGYAYAPGAYVVQAAPAAPLLTGRSVATGQLGDFCTTPVKTCQLVNAGYVGGGCSCRVTGGRARGSVTP